MLKKSILLLILSLFTLPYCYAQRDSIFVERMLKRGKREATQPLHLWYAHQFLETPYVAQTLEVNPKEKLVVNVRQLDCTTFVETALALALTQSQGSTRYIDYCRNLIRIRYRDGLLSGYHSRNHYFSQWIDSNARQGFVSEPRIYPGILTETQTLDLHYMSLHPQSYPMLKDDTDAQVWIKKYEQEYQGRKVKYIPRAELDKHKLSAVGQLIQDGDILAIVTNKDGLDISHIGFAEWGEDGTLHLLNASQIHKKVVLEPMTLYQYMGEHPSQLGIRVIHVLP